MSEATNVPAGQSGIQKPLPVWLSAGVIGLALGTGVTMVAMHTIGYRMENKEGKTESAGGATAGAPASGGGMSGMGGGGGSMGMMGGGGGGMMGGGGGGMMGGGGGGGGARGKRTLTSLVGKLELLTRGNLHVELAADQSSKIAAKLAEWDALEKMTADEAQSAVDELESLLTAEQKAALDSIGLPFGRPGGGGGGPGGGGGGMMSAGGISMGGGPGGGPGGSDEDNPFRQESNQKRLRDLLDRLQPSKGESTPAQ